jgi:nicotinamidase/pyrazinamidase
MAATYSNSRVVLWEVDTQADFMLPGGKLYVPGAEKRIPNMRKLVDAARAGKALLISSTDQHAPDDPEFQRFPPHCVAGTSGAEIVPELKARDSIHVKNSSTSAVPASVSAAQQVIIEKQTLDVFDNPATEKLLTHLPLDCDFILFGVVTELCVRFAARGLLDRGRRVALVTDAIEALDAKEGKNALNEVEERGARLITTSDALELIEQSSNRS